MGRTPPSTAFPSLGMTNLVPQAFPKWTEQMEEWGEQIKRAVEGVAEALSIGLGLERDTLTKAAEYGSHLLAPTATDLRTYGKEGESESLQLGRLLGQWLTDFPTQSLPGFTRISTS